MKCLSLWQPYASLIAYGFKKVETRDAYAARWSTFRGPLLIHAAKRWTREERETWDAFRRTWPDLAAVMPLELPLGAIVAVVYVDEVRVMDAEWCALQTAMELDFGGWGPGRVGIRMPHVERLDPPIACVGHQGMFDVTPRDVGRAYVRLDEAWDKVKARGAGVNCGGR
jgi:hypothetical protein